MAALELYGTKTCQYTQEMREWLEWKGTEFVEYDVETDAAAREPGRGEASAGEPRGASGLPQRQRDQVATSSSWRRPWAPGRTPELRAPLGLLRPRANRDTRSGETS